VKLRKKYKDLNDTLYHLKIQIIHSLDFADQWLPDRNMSPAEIFKLLKKNVIYTPDPPGVELIQTMQTMFDYWNNPHGMYGAGDCDCFTVTAAACLHVCNYPVEIALVGRQSDNAVHIYCMTGRKYPIVPFDLTNSAYGYERPYPYKQNLPLLIN
jgi:hypothetical protein